MKKIYIHHKYSELLFKKIAHNTTHRVYNNEIVDCEFNGIKYQFLFNEELNNNNDGYHLIDYFTIQKQNTNIPDYKIIEGIYEKIKDRDNWLITIFRTEKIINDFDNNPNYKIEKLETAIKLLSNHIIITDNMFINEDAKRKYPNFHYAFTNIIFEWNNIIGIRWYYEFKNVFNRLNFDYDLCYSVRNYKNNRVKILNGLNDLTHNILTIRTNSNMNDSYYENLDKLNNIKLNSIFGNNDFEDISNINNLAIGTDLFFRILSTAKMQILDESWSWNSTDFSSQYFSEKTFGLLLSGIPFISTHTYPLDMISKILNVPKHPFYDKSLNGNPLKFINFVNDFMNNFDYNYNTCKEWSINVNTELIKKINTENSLLTMITDGFENKGTVNLI